MSSRPQNPAAADSPPLEDPRPQWRAPSRWSSTWLFVWTDLAALWRSWLCRGFLLVSVGLTILALKGMQAEQKSANEMLEVVYTTYLLIWMHAVIFIAGSALMREADCLNDAILSRGVTRGEYFAGKCLARFLAVLFLTAGVLLPCSLWAIRQDKLLRTEDGFVTSAARNTKVEAWEPRKVFAEVNGTLKECHPKVGDFVKNADVIAVFDDRSIFDELETERRNEENARNEVNNAKRRIEEATRNVAQAEDALERAERGLIAKDLLSKAEQADRQTEIRSRKRDLKNAETQLRTAEEAVSPAERNVENAVARVGEARRRLARATVQAPLAGYVTEVLANPAQFINVGAHLYTIAPLDDYQVRVPIYKFEEFKRLKEGLTAYVKIEQTEYKGTIARLGATTQPDRWGRDSNYGVVRFKGEGALGLLGLPADVRLVLPPRQGSTNQIAALLQVLTGGGAENPTRTASVTVGWMLAALGKVVGTAGLLVTVSLFAVVLLRNSLVAILATIGFYHISNLVFDFVGLKQLSYIEMVKDLDKILGGIAKPGDELASLAWLLGFAIAFGAAAAALFVSRDPVR